MTTEQESGLEGEINIYEGEDGRNAVQTDPETSTSNAGSSSSCSTIADIERAVRPLVEMVTELKQQQSDIVRLIRALLRSLDTKQTTDRRRDEENYAKSKRDTDTQLRSGVEDVEPEGEPVDEVTVEQMVGDLMHKFRLTTL